MLDYNDPKVFNALGNGTVDEWFDYLKALNNVPGFSNESKETPQDIKDTHELQDMHYPDCAKPLDLRVEITVKRVGYSYRYHINGWESRSFYCNYDDKLLEMVTPTSHYSYYPIIGQLAGIAALYPGWDQDVNVTIDVDGPVIMTSTQEEKFQFMFYERLLAHRGVYELPYKVDRKINFIMEDRLYEEIEFSPIKEKTSLLLFSLGKESTLTKHISEKVLGFDTLPIIIDEGGYGVRQRNLELEKPHNDKVCKIGSNIKQFYNQVKYTDKLNWTRSGDHIELIFGFFMYDIAKKLGISDLLVGNEIDSTAFRRTPQGDSFLHKVLFDTGIHYEKFMTSFYRDSFKKDTDKFMSYSILPIFESAVAEILFRIDDENKNNLIPCWSPSTQYKWCGNCPKCCRYMLLFETLDVEPPKELKDNAERRSPNWKEIALEADIADNAQYEEEHRNKLFTYRIEYMPEAIRETLTEFYLSYGRIPNSEKRYPPMGDCGNV